jgi:hypothetical protein
VILFSVGKEAPGGRKGIGKVDRSSVVKWNPCGDDREKKRDD